MRANCTVLRVSQNSDDRSSVDVILTGDGVRLSLRVADTEPMLADLHYGSFVTVDVDVEKGRV